MRIEKQEKHVKINVTEDRADFENERKRIDLILPQQLTDVSDLTSNGTQPLKFLSWITTIIGLKFIIPFNLNFQ